jgi:hypothetical protein
MNKKTEEQGTKKKRKLELRKETLRKLDQRDLSAVRGGGGGAAPPDDAGADNGIRVRIQ